MKKFLNVFIALIIIPLSLAGCGGCGVNKDYTGTYRAKIGSYNYELKLTLSGKFSYRTLTEVLTPVEVDLEKVNGTYTIDDSGDVIKITLSWKVTEPAPKNVESPGTISKDGKSITVKIYGEKTFKKI